MGTFWTVRCHCPYQWLGRLTTQDWCHKPQAVNICMVTGNRSFQLFRLKHHLNMERHHQTKIDQSIQSKSGFKSKHISVEICLTTLQVLLHHSPVCLSQSLWWLWTSQERRRKRSTHCSGDRLEAVVADEDNVEDRRWTKHVVHDQPQLTQSSTQGPPACEDVRDVDWDAESTWWKGIRKWGK